MQVSDYFTLLSVSLPVWQISNVVVVVVTLLSKQLVN